MKPVDSWPPAGDKVRSPGQMFLKCQMLSMECLHFSVRPKTHLSVHVVELIWNRPLEYKNNFELGEIVWLQFFLSKGSDSKWSQHWIVMRSLWVNNSGGQRHHRESRVWCTNKQMLMEPSFSPFFSWGPFISQNVIFPSYQKSIFLIYYILIRGFPLSTALSSFPPPLTCRSTPFLPPVR